MDEHGAPGAVLRLDPDYPEPLPGPGQVAIRVAACGLNFADSLLCLGTYQERPPLPFTPGLEVAGTIAAVGDGVDRARHGERVVALAALPAGGLAETCLAADGEAWTLPPDVDDVTAAALPITYGTAWVGLFHRGEVVAGDTVLVHAGAGGTGSSALQLAVSAGATVFATAGGDEKVALCRQMGATEAWDSRADGFDLVSLVRRATSDRGVDVVFDPVGGDLFDVSRRVVAFEGRYLVVGFASGRIPEAPTNHLLLKNYALVGVHWGAYRSHRPDVLADAHEGVLAAVESGRVEPLIGATPTFEAAASALDDLANRRTTGKVVVRIAG